MRGGELHNNNEERVAAHTDQSNHPCRRPLAKDLKEKRCVVFFCFSRACFFLAGVANRISFLFCFSYDDGTECLGKSTADVEMSFLSDGQKPSFSFCTYQSTVSWKPASNSTSCFQPSAASLLESMS